MKITITFDPQTETLTSVLKRVREAYTGRPTPTVMRGPRAPRRPDVPPSKAPGGVVHLWPTPKGQPIKPGDKAACGHVRTASEDTASKRPGFKKPTSKCGQCVEASGGHGPRWETQPDGTVAAHRR